MFCWVSCLIFCSITDWCWVSASRVWEVNCMMDTLWVLA